MCKSFLVLLGLTMCSFASGSPEDLIQDQWRVAGHDAANSRNQPAERLIGPQNVHSLAVKWVFTTGGDVSATPTVFGDAVFFPDSAGNLYSVNAHTGQLIWSHKISEYDGVAGAISRNSPAIHGDDVIIGDIQAGFGPHDGANLISVDRQTGALRWITRVDDHVSAVITGSPVVFGDAVYVGVSSQEESLALLDNPFPIPPFSIYHCCTFRGSVVAVNANTGELLWKTYDMPDNGGQPGGYSGGAIWQPPAIDPIRHLLFVGTGNNYSAPDSVLECQTQAIANHDPNAECTAPDDFFETALALDLNDGHIRWAKRLQDYDVWTVPCIVAGFGTCPSPAGPDYDLGGSGPNILPALGLVGFGQKSGVYWGLNLDDGSVRWKTGAGPGGGTGGIQWGTATDGWRIYVAEANSNKVSYTLAPSGQTITWGAWSALNAFTGKPLWQTADPTVGAIDMGSVSVANGVVYAGSQSGSMYALDAADGEVLWSFASGGTVLDGPAIVDGVIYWGSGYNNPGTPNNQLYAFSIPGTH